MAARAGPELALANHLVMGPVILAAGARARHALRGQGPRQRAGVHRQARTGALPRPGPRGPRAGRRRCSWAPATRPRACGRRSPTPACRERTRLGPPGRGRGPLRAPASTAGRSPRCAALAGALRARPRGAARRRAGSAFARDPRAGRRGARAGGGGGPAGGVRRQADRQQGPRPAARGLPAGARAPARAHACWWSASGPSGRAWNGSPRRCRPASSSGCGSSPAPGARWRASAAAGQPLGYLLAFLDGLEGAAAERYLAAARRSSERVLFTGRLEHEELAELLPACSAHGGPEHLPRGLRDGRRRGRRLRDAAGQRGPLGARGGQPGAGRAACPRRSARCCPSSSAPARCEAIAARLLAWLECEPAVQRAHPRGAGRDRPRAVVLGERGRGRDRGGPRGARGAPRALSRAGPARRRSRTGPPAVRIVFAPASAEDPPQIDHLCARGRVGLRGRDWRCCRSRGSPCSPPAGCSVKGADNANLITGKQQFVAKCGACHTLARANTKGIVGPEPRRRLPARASKKGSGATRSAASSNSRSPTRTRWARCRKTS